MSIPLNVPADPVSIGVPLNALLTVHGSSTPLERFPQESADAIQVRPGMPPQVHVTSIAPMSPMLWVQNQTVHASARSSTTSITLSVNASSTAPMIRTPTTGQPTQLNVAAFQATLGARRTKNVPSALPELANDEYDRIIYHLLTEEHDVTSLR